MAYADSIRTTDYTREELADLIDGNHFVNEAVTTGGTSPNYTVTLSPAPAAYYEGLTFAIKPNVPLGAGTPTLNVNGLGAKNLVMSINQTSIRALTRYELNHRGYYLVSYNSASDYFVVHNPTFGGHPIAFTPTVSSAAGTATLNATGNDSWYAYQSATLIRVHYQANVSLAGSTSSYIALSLPLNNDLDDNSTFGIASVESASGYSSRAAECFISSNVLRFFRPDLTNWAIDASFYLYGTLLYRIPN